MISIPTLAFPDGIGWELDVDTALLDGTSLYIEPTGGVREILLHRL